MTTPNTDDPTPKRPSPPPRPAPPPRQPPGTLPPPPPYVILVIGLSMGVTIGIALDAVPWGIAIGLGLGGLLAFAQAQGRR